MDKNCAKCGESFDALKNDHLLCENCFDRQRVLRKNALLLWNHNRLRKDRKQVEGTYAKDLFYFILAND